MDDEITEFCIIAKYLIREMNKDIESLLTTWNYLESKYGNNQSKLFFNSCEKDCIQVKKLLDNIDKSIGDFYRCVN